MYVAFLRSKAARSALGLVVISTSLYAGEPSYPVGCPGLDPVELTVTAYPGVVPPDPLPDEPIRLDAGDLFTVAVDVGALGNNAFAFLLVTLDDNKVNGDTGDLIGFAPIFAPGHFEFSAIVPGDYSGSYYAAATLISDEMGHMGCNNVAQEYNTIAPLLIDGACLGDANGDGLIDPLDVGYVLSRFDCPVGEGDPLCDLADANEDGAVDPLDAGFVLARIGDCG